MKIALLRDEPDARTFKVRRALRDTGVDATEFVRLPPYHELFGVYATEHETTTYRFFYDDWSLAFALRHLALPNALSYARLGRRLALEGFDIFHCNSVTEHLAAGILRWGGGPVITEVYDATSLYEIRNLRRALAKPGSNFSSPRERFVEHVIANALQWERVSHETSAGLVYTTSEMLEYAKSIYDIQCPSVIVPNAVYGKFLPRSPPLAKWSVTEGGLHLVYTGGIRDSLFGNHRDICDQLNRLAKSDTFVHIYPVIPDSERDRVHRKLDSNKNIRWHDPLPHSALYAQLRRYDAGLVLLAPFDKELLDVALPNKLFDYVAAGIPAIVSPYRPLKRFVADFHCGTVLNEPEDTFGTIPREVPFHDEFTIEHYIPGLIRLYRDVLS